MKFIKLKAITRLPDAILFDLDDTLYSYSQAHEKAQFALKTKVVEKLSISSVDFETSYEEARLQIKARLKNTASSHSRLLYLQRMLEILGLGSQVLLALDFEKTYWGSFLRNAVLFEGVRDLIEDIRLIGIPSAIVTDLTAEVQFKKLIYFGLDQSFDYIVTSEEAGFDKPHQAPFSLALEKIKPKGGCVWMVGDDPINDIKGAKQYIQAITIQKIHHDVELGKGSNEPDAYFEEFSELKKLINSLTNINETF